MHIQVPKEKIDTYLWKFGKKGRVQMEKVKLPKQ